MAILFGYTSYPAEALSNVFHQVKHRGGQNFQSGFMPSMDLQVGFSIGSQEVVHQHSSGLYQQETQSIVVAGNVTDRHHQRLSPQQILQLYKDQGIACLQNLMGAYVMVICDGNQIYLVRDDTGLRTVYYSVQNNRLMFCNEAKGIYALPFFNKVMNKKAIATYFTYSFLPLQTTMMQDVYELPAGSYLHYTSPQHTKVVRFFKGEQISKSSKLSVEHWSHTIRTQVRQEITDHLFADQETGVFLSGGLDSSIIAAQAASLSDKPIHTFSIHFGNKYRNELYYADLIAKKYQTYHHEVEIKPKNFLPTLRKSIWHLDDPIGDPITIPNMELARFASEITPVIFNGEGGDPCFGGPKNIPMLLEHWYDGINQEKNFREKSYLASYRRGYAYLDQILAPELLQALDKQSLETILTPFFEQPTQNFLDKLMSINMRLKGAHLILPKVERMLGAVGVTPISPLFTAEIVQSSLAMPSTLKLHQGIEKYILKQAFQGDIPSQIIKRPKSGMRVPLHYWFRGEMKKYAKKILSPKNVKAAGLFNPKTVKLILKYDKSTGIRRHGLLLWMMITLEIWRRIFIENESL